VSNSAIDQLIAKADTSILEAETILTSLQGEGVLASLQPETGGFPHTPLGVENPKDQRPDHQGELAEVQSLLSSSIKQGEGQGVDLAASLVNAAS
jgi:hypothetical protein